MLRITLYYAPWCVWSQQFIPAWNQIKYELDQIKPNLYREYKDTGSMTKKFNILGYPTIRIEKGGVEYDYNNKDRTAKAILTEFLKGINISLLKKQNDSSDDDDSTDNSDDYDNDQIDENNTIINI
ncbi:MAG: hypothetical protein Edafosvirus18_11 [Edafosvirus sp.]|uniref:Thioredoxin domain-containing protein n=1 Tax=Edafosvirus sp. TaxID=2487765 RepID=A0A3G4ZUI1_9VIRU|nr:MAG: hypothetical protein Edafosvirus18_11 [Edafosvirus sp.]